jgi:subtilisin family serine protease
VKLRFGAVVLLVALTTTSALAERRYIVRDTLGLTGLTNGCLRLGCTVERALGDPLDQLFLVTSPLHLDLLADLLDLLGVVHVEVDQLVAVDDAQATEAPASLYDDTPVGYHGSMVWNGYLTQPAVDIVRAPMAASEWQLTGGGVVAVIDTGVDPDHPALERVLLSGYDFTRNRNGGSEMADVDQRTAAVLDDAEPALVNARTMAVVDQRTAAVLDDEDLRAFGHGTMVAGVVHLIAPQASILPLKAFRADGTGYASDVIRAIYYAVGKNAKVINMSFSFGSPSAEVRRATEYATLRRAICVAAAGNDGAAVDRYPAALWNVTGVASTSNDDTRSSFSNHGTGLVWVAAPGEAVVSTYPGSTYAAGWGTSFSVPMVSGAAALMVQVSATLNQVRVDRALATAVYISPELNHGRLDLYAAIAAWRAERGLD